MSPVADAPALTEFQIPEAYRGMVVACDNALQSVLVPDLEAALPAMYARLATQYREHPVVRGRRPGAPDGVE
jgi:hypothetical protein